MELGLEGKTVIVTGAGQGLGKAIAEKFAGEGANVVAADIQAEKVEALAGEIGAGAIGVRVDVTSNDDLERLIKAAKDAFGGVDIVINNAGICPRTGLEEISEAEWDKVMAVNLRGAFVLSQKAFGCMKEKGYGRIINIASGAGKVGGVQVGAHYAASKAGLICLTKTLALHGAKYGINVNAVCPGVVDTEITTCIGEEKIAKYEKMIPLGRIGGVDEIAEAVVFLASDAASYITGEITDVNGGFIMD